MASRKRKLVSADAPMTADDKLAVYCTMRGIDREAFVKSVAERFVDQDYLPDAEPYRLRRPEPLLSSLTAVDLFSGAGGITLGLSNAGFNVLLGADIDKACAATTIAT